MDPNIRILDGLSIVFWTVFEKYFGKVKKRGERRRGEGVRGWIRAGAGGVMAARSTVVDPGV